MKHSRRREGREADQPPSSQTLTPVVRQARIGDVAVVRALPDQFYVRSSAQPPSSQTLNPCNLPSAYP